MDFSIIPPGYITNFKTAKNQPDGAYPVIPVVGVCNNSLSLKLSLSIGSTLGITPNDEIRIAERKVPDNFSAPYVMHSDGQSYSMANVQDGEYFLSSFADCGSGVSTTCHDNVEAEVTVQLLYTGTSTHFAYEVLNQRRTSKFNLDPNSWQYFWLAVTNDLLVNGVFDLYIGIQFYSNKDNSGVAVYVYDTEDGLPTGQGSTTIAKAYGPQPGGNSWTGDWTKDQYSRPNRLYVGTFNVGALNTKSGVQAQYTMKDGFNAPPVQAASFTTYSRLGLLSLLFFSCLWNLKNF